MNPKLKQSKKTKKKIIQISRRLFIKNGYEKTSTRMISTELAMSTGSIFVHFKSKQEILISILYEEINNAINKGFKKSEKEVDLDSKILSIFEPVFKFYFSEVEFSRELLKAALFERHEMLLDQINTFNLRLESLVKIAVETGEIRCSNNHFTVSKIIFSYYLNILLKEICYEKEPSTKRAISDLKHVFDIIF